MRSSLQAARFRGEMRVADGAAPRAPNRGPSGFSVATSVAALCLTLGLGATVFGCSLTNVSRSDCTSDNDCAAAFGPGSKCSAGFCSDPKGCTTGHDCRQIQGGGACVEGACVAQFPVDAQCNLAAAPPEPPDLFSKPLVGDDAPLVIGSIFALESAREVKLTQAVRLAVQEINQAGLDGGQKLGVVFCDNGGAKNETEGAAREELNQHAVDYLAGTLGVPYLVGPLTSSDAIALVNRMLKQAYPTVIISPSATSPGLTTNTDRLDPKDPYGLFWRTCPSDEFQGAVLAKNVISEDKTILRVTVIYVDDPYGQGLRQVFQKAWPGGVTAVDLFPYTAATLNDPVKLAKLIDDADAANGDAVLIIAHQSGTEDSAARKILDAMGGKTIATKRFFFTDGTKSKESLFKAPIPDFVQTILQGAMGTAPASPSGQDYDIFDTNLFASFGLHASDESFLAQSYDAAYIGAFGVAHAVKKKSAFTGLDVAEGLSKLSAGTQVHLNGVNAWTSGKGLIVQEGQIDVEGASGPLDFDASTGEAPGPIEVWGVAADLSDFTQIKIVPP